MISHVSNNKWNIIFMFLLFRCLKFLIVSILLSKTVTFSYNQPHKNDIFSKLANHTLYEIRSLFLSKYQSKALTVNSLWKWRLIAVISGRRPLEADLRPRVVVLPLEVRPVFVPVLLLRVRAVVELRVRIRVGGGQRQRGVLVGQRVLFHVAL